MSAKLIIKHGWDDLIDILHFQGTLNIWNKIIHFQSFCLSFRYNLFSFFIQYFLDLVLNGSSEYESVHNPLGRNSQFWNNLVIWKTLPLGQYLAHVSYACFANFTSNQFSEQV